MRQSTWSTSPRCPTSTRCTSCTMTAQSCSSTATSTSWSTWGPVTTTRSTGPSRTSKSSSISSRRSTEARPRDEVSSSAQKITQQDIVTENGIPREISRPTSAPTSAFMPIEWPEQAGLPPSNNLTCILHTFSCKFSFASPGQLSFYLVAGPLRSERERGKENKRAAKS